MTKTFEKIVEMYGLKFGDRFDLVYTSPEMRGATHLDGPFHFDQKLGLVDIDGYDNNHRVLSEIIMGHLVIRKTVAPILQENERIFLKSLIDSFVCEIDFIKKLSYTGGEDIFIFFYKKEVENPVLKFHAHPNMLKGVPAEVLYSIEELGLDYKAVYE